MGVLAYSAVVVGGIAIYMAFNSARSGGGYLKSYLLSGVAMLLGLFFGATSILAGEFISGLVGLVGGFFAIGTVVSIAVFGLVKENPEGAAAAASAAVGAASAIDEMSDDSTSSGQPAGAGSSGSSSSTAKQQKKEITRDDVKAKSAEWKMNCPSCGQQWAFNGSGMISGKDRIGYTYVGYNDTLEKTEIQCENCGTTKRVNRKI